MNRIEYINKIDFMINNIIKIISVLMCSCIFIRCKQSSNQKFDIPKEKLQHYILNEFENRLSKHYSKREVCLFKEVVTNHLIKNFNHPSQYDNFIIHHFSCYPYLELKFHLISEKSDIKCLIFENTLNDSILDTKKFIKLSRVDSLRLLNVIQSDEIQLIELVLNNNYTLLSNEEKELSNDDIVDLPKALIYEIYKEQYFTWTAISTFTVVRSYAEFLHCLLELKTTEATSNDIQLINEFVINNQLYNPQTLILHNKNKGILLFKIDYEREKDKVHYSITKSIIYNSNIEPDLWNDINFNSLFKECSDITE